MDSHNNSSVDPELADPRIDESSVTELREADKSICVFRSRFCAKFDDSTSYKTHHVGMLYEECLDLHVG